MINQYEFKSNYQGQCFQEAIEDKPEDKFDKRVEEILITLRDNNYGNADSRREFIDLITTLHNSNDPGSRKTFKELGNFFTDMSDELIKHGQEE